MQIVLKSNSLHLYVLASYLGFGHVLLVYRLILWGGDACHSSLLCKTLAQEHDGPGFGSKVQAESSWNWTPESESTNWKRPKMIN